MTEQWRIKLRANGYVFENATRLPGDLFSVVKADGKTKIYELKDLKSIENVDLHSEEDSPKGGDNIRKIITYLQKVLFRDETDPTDIGVEVTARFITNNPGPSIKKNYEESLDQHIPVRNTLGLTGWPFGLLDETLNKKGRTFKIMVIPNEQLAMLSTGALTSILVKSTMSYANASYSFFVRIDGEAHWGLSAMGLTINMVPKAAKRLQEVCRQAEQYLMLEGKDAMKTLSIVFPTVPGDENWDEMTEDERAFHTMLWDGHVFMRRSAAIRTLDHIEDITHRNHIEHEIAHGRKIEWILRAETPYGEIKCNVTLVPDNQINADIVAHDSAVKKEFFSDDYVFMALVEHEPMHMAVWDDQTTIEVGHALPMKAILADIDRLIETERAINKAGTLPPWLDMGATAHDDAGVPHVEKLSKTINASAQRLHAAGRDVRMSANLTFMVRNIVPLRMTAADQVEGFWKKMWVPMSNAVLASVVTWEAARYLGGFSFPKQNKNICFYDKRIGFVMPGQRFVEGYRYHGGWDMDDQVKIILVKVWCSDRTILEEHKGKTIPSTSHYADKAHEARVMALLLRSPNAPGEWTLEEVNVHSLINVIPEGLRHDNLTVIDIAKMPLPADLLEQGIVITGLPPQSTVYSYASMTLADSINMVKAQMKNPNIGSFCNPIMAYNTIFPGFPPVMLERMEKMVDTCQQGFDIAQFEAIAAEGRNIIQYAFGMSMSRAIMRTRVSPTLWSWFSVIDDDRYTKTQIKYNQAIHTITTENRENTLKMRSEQDIIIRVRNMHFSNALRHWANHFYNEYNGRLGNVDRAFNTDGVRDPFAKMTLKHGKKVAMEAIVNEMVTKFESHSENSRYIRVLALLNFIVTPQVDDEYGFSDRIIYQPNALGKKSMMDILLEALSTIN